MFCFENQTDNSAIKAEKEGCNDVSFLLCIMLLAFNKHPFLPPVLRSQC